MAKRRELAITFDGSYEGFFNVVYAYYYEGLLPLSIQTEENYQQSLAAEEFFVATNFDYASRVQSAFRKKVSNDAEERLYLASLTEDDNRFMDMFLYVLLGFKVGYLLDNHLQQDCVLGVHKRARYVGREAHLLTGFCRFAETKSGVFYCPVEPVNDCLLILAEHFADRMMNQAWLIHDKRRNKAAVYNGYEYIISQVPRDVHLEYADKERQIQQLWGTFFRSVTIKERVKKSLQRNNLPLYFRKHMTEFLLDEKP